MMVRWDLNDPRVRVFDDLARGREAREKRVTAVRAQGGAMLSQQANYSQNPIWQGRGDEGLR